MFTNIALFLDYVCLSYGEDGDSVTYQTSSVSPGMSDVCWVTWWKVSVLPMPLLPKLWNRKDTITEPESASEEYTRNDR